MTRPLRIGVAAMNFAQLGEGGGLSIYVRQLVEALAECDRANEYFIFLYDYSLPSWNSRTWPANVKLVTLSWKQPARTLFARAGDKLLRILGITTSAYSDDEFLARQIDDLGLDLVHFPCTTISPLAVKTRSLVTFFDLQQEYYPEFFTQSELDARAYTYKASIEKAAKVLVPSHYTWQSLLEKYSVPAEKLTLVPVGIRADVRPVDRETVARVCSKYGLPSEYIYYPANPWPHKNHARLIAAIRLYRQRLGEPPKLVLSGRLRNEVRDVQSLAVAAGVEDCIIDLGFVPSEDLPGLYTGAMALIFPSLFEGFGIPLLEAMAYGCPVAAANATAIPECVGEAAILFDPFSPDAIATAIHRLYIDKDLRQELRTAGLQRAQQFHWHKIVPQIVDVYKTVAD